MGYSYEKYSPEIRAWTWSELVGLGIALIPLMPIPIWAIMTIWQSCRHGARSTPCRVGIFTLFSHFPNQFENV
jgi:hypothetical protein